MTIAWIASSPISCSSPQVSTLSKFERPNIVLVVIDSLRSDALSCYGYHRKTSPFMDKFASEAVVFKNAVSIATSTPPAMAGIMTSRMPYYEPGLLWKNGLWYGMKRFGSSDYEGGLPNALDTFAEILNRNGYATAGFITNPYLVSGFHFDQGFDTYREIFSPGEIVPYGLAEEVTGKAMHWLEGIGEVPFFLYLHYMDVHFPYLPPNEYRHLFSYPRVEGKPEETLQQIWRSRKDLADPENANIKEHMRGLYDEGIAYTDYWIGELLKYLDSTDLADNTIVIITSDHGEEFLEHGSTLHGATPYEEVIRIPLMIRVPGNRPQEIDALVRNFDVMPTVLDLAEIETADESYDAVSLRPLLDDKVETLGLIGMTNFPAKGFKRRESRLQAIRTNEYKFIFLPDQAENSELYILSEDPFERSNVYASERLAVRQTLRDQLETTFKKFEMESQQSVSTREDSIELDEETQEQLRALGYVE